MQKTNTIWAIVPAAGIGERMKADRPKQYLPLSGQRVIDHALASLCQNDLIKGMVVGIRKGDEWWQEQPFSHAKLLAVSEGGSHRAGTVLNALQRLLQDTDANADSDDWVMVHDAARPCLCQEDIARLSSAADTHGHGAVLALKVTDTLKQANREGLITDTLDNNEKNRYWRAVTPQMFRCGELATALQKSLAQDIIPPDESSAMEMAGVTAAVVEGRPTNIKITESADIELTEMIVQNMLAKPSQS